MKRIAVIFITIILGNSIVQAELTIPEIPEDTVVVTRKQKTKEEQPKNDKKINTPKITKTTPEKQNNKKSDKENNNPPKQKTPSITGLKIYEQPKPEPKIKATPKPTKCKEDPKSPCNAHKAKPAQPRKRSTSKGKKQPRKAQPAKPRKIIPCT